MQIKYIRCIDKMRIIEKKGYISVITKREDIETAVENFFGFFGFHFFGFSSKTIDAEE